MLLCALADFVQWYATLSSPGSGTVNLTTWAGTVRTALDPFSRYDDACLWDALQRSFLVESRSATPEAYSIIGNSSDTHVHQARITLDTVIEPEGANFSVGERSLLSLARALVKDSKVVILDEAT